MTTQPTNLRVAQWLSDLQVREDDNEFTGLWYLTAPLVFYSALLARTLTVPANFATDFASVPRWLPLAYQAYGGRGNKAAVVHDWLYTAQCVSRETADKVLREALLASGYSAVTAAAFFYAVRLGGASHWDAPNQPQPLDVIAAMGERYDRAGG